ncbi:hypothetical protein [Wenyingzhuangia sp. 2_MG-2023]|uniref:hypothetical protein n=1 Tax=Wenyingzhuangia sp. 2_MG-2023 TaxID=3062639 RepID=UPI0026E15803|nr:hypothetical protein [Wenyingzhuangia sp. 2_MG-2023]MDO6737647.1 hypothetical protein [Wenyingzhuangia sp. 2_MG-2023]
MVFNKENQQLIKEIEDTMSNYILKTYKKGNTKRDAHPKTHAVVKGLFHINPDLPETLKIGLFNNPSSYQAVIRFSNASHIIKPDSKPDIRGISIKLLGIKGDRVKNSIETKTQDILLMTHPTMPLGTLKKFHNTITNTVNTNILKRLFWVVKNKTLFNKIRQAEKTHNSLSDLSYWSTTTYAFGDKIIKYKLTPKVHENKTYAINQNPNFLKERLISELTNNDIVFDFCVQFYKNDTLTPLDDMSLDWDETLNPFLKVATLVIPSQTVKEQPEIDKLLTFSLTNSLLAHKAVGELNEVRIKIYQKLAQLRHKLNHLDLKEFTENDYNNL